MIKTILLGDDIIVVGTREYGEKKFNYEYLRSKMSFLFTAHHRSGS